MKSSEQGEHGSWQLEPRAAFVLTEPFNWAWRERHLMSPAAQEWKGQASQRRSVNCNAAPMVWSLYKENGFIPHQYLLGVYCVQGNVPCAREDAKINLTGLPSQSWQSAGSSKVSGKGVPGVINQIRPSPRQHTHNHTQRKNLFTRLSFIYFLLVQRFT